MSESASHLPVSVCIPTCNRAELLREAIASVLSQTFADFELIVSDNASVDHTRSVVQSFRDRRIQYVGHKANIGAVANFNHCFDLAKGSYITVFHDDDRMMPENLRQKVRALEEHPRAGLVYSGFEVIDGEGNVVERPGCREKQDAAEQVEAGHDFLVRMLQGNIVCPPSVMLRRECYARLGGFSDKVLFTSDYEYWMRIATHYDVVFLANPLIQYRTHPGWGTSRYMQRINGSLVPTLCALEEEFLAKRLIFKQWEGRRKERRRIQDRVHEQEVEQLEAVFQAPVEGQFDDPAERKALIRICRRRPALLVKKPVLKFFLKQYGGERAFGTIKRLAGRRKANRSETNSTVRSKV